MKFVDLSIPLINPNELLFDPGGTELKIEYNDHTIGAKQMGRIFNLTPEKHLPIGTGWATERITISTHNGTHMDAPWHFAPIQDRETGQKKAMTIDEIPLEWCIGPLIVLDCTNYEDGYVLTPEDVDQKLKSINYRLKGGEILCIHTTAPQYYGTREFVHHGVGVGKSATLHIVRHGVHIVGTDSWSWDAPFSITTQKWEKNKDPSIIWEGHFAGIERGYFQMEKLANLEKVPPVGATIYCFPIKIARASAGWVRAVATLPE